MKNAIITVIPSRKEAMSMVALESSLVGTPFLASEFCGLDDFEENSSGTFVMVIQYLFQRN